MQTLRSSLLALALLGSLAACGPSSPPDPDAGAPPDPAVLDIDVAAGATLTHAPTGLRFQFRDGGRGQLTVRERTDTTTPLPGASVFEITFDGTTPVELVLPKVEGHHAQAFAFGNVPGTCDGPSPRDQRWGALPPRTSATAEVTFNLPLPVESALDPLPAQTTYATLAIPRDIGDITLEAKARGYLAQAVAMLPETVRTTVQARLDTAPPTFAFNTTDSSYVGFDWGPWAGTYASPVVTLRLDADDDVVAHEIGHLVTHLLAGDTAYKAIADLAPDENHGIGVDLGRATLTEDYAYFVEYALGRNRACNHMRAILGERDPATVDVPALEGFGCVLLGALTSATVDFARLPMVGGGFTPGEVLSAYQAGATTIDALWPVLETFLADRGKAGALPVLAEAVGWSYRVTGTVADTDGTVIPDAPVRLMRADYSTIAGASDTADAVGAFELNRALPLHNDFVLRMPGTDAVPVLPFEIEYTRRTNAPLQQDFRFPVDSAHVVTPELELPFVLGDFFSSTIRYTLTLDVNGFWNRPEQGWIPGGQSNWSMKNWRDTSFALSVVASMEGKSYVRENAEVRVEATVELQPRFEVTPIFGLGTPGGPGGTNIVLGGPIAWTGRIPAGGSAGSTVWVEVTTHETHTNKQTGAVILQWSPTTKVYLGNLYLSS